MLPFDFKNCPVECTLNTIGGKWSINIMRDLFLGKTRFSQFLQTNHGLSSKVLSTRLKELQTQQLVEKIAVELTPLKIEYKLTEKGRALGDVLYHLAIKETATTYDKYSTQQPNTPSNPISPTPTNEP